MRKTISILPVSFVLFILSGCLKDKSTPPCTPKTVESEQPQMAAFATANGISYTAHPSGVYYEITNPGSGASPTVNSRVIVTYTGKLVSNGVVFDSQITPNPNGWPLSTLISGWQVGLPLLHKGGSIKLILPSTFGYGCRGNSSVPPDAILYFEVTLVDIE